MKAALLVSIFLLFASVGSAQELYKLTKVEKNFLTRTQECTLTDTSITYANNPGTSISPPKPDKMRWSLSVTWDKPPEIVRKGEDIVLGMHGTGSFVQEGYQYYTPALSAHVGWIANREQVVVTSKTKSAPPDYRPQYFVIVSPPQIYTIRTATEKFYDYGGSISVLFDGACIGEITYFYEKQKCADPFVEHDGRCVCKDKYVEKAGTCVCKEPFIGQNGQCVCPQSFVEKNGQCVCPQGTKEQNGICAPDCAAADQRIDAAFATAPSLSAEDLSLRNHALAQAEMTLQNYNAQYQVSNPAPPITGKVIANLEQKLALCEGNPPFQDVDCSAFSRLTGRAAADISSVCVNVPEQPCPVGGVEGLKRVANQGISDWVYWQGQEPPKGKVIEVDTTWYYTCLNGDHEEKRSFESCVTQEGSGIECYNGKLLHIYYKDGGLWEEPLTATAIRGVGKDRADGPLDRGFIAVPKQAYKNYHNKELWLRLLTFDPQTKKFISSNKYIKVKPKDIGGGITGMESDWWHIDVYVGVSRAAGKDWGGLGANSLSSDYLSHMTLPG
ncbi:hypothetical protein HY639_02045 [Candidatus Woesearchaeota archaeon]|nr:hypothetical protein [Candidatus Woesearchaeota archaeon]